MSYKPVIAIGLTTLERLMRGEDVDTDAATLIAASDLASAAPIFSTIEPAPIPREEFIPPLPSPGLIPMIDVAAPSRQVLTFVVDPSTPPIFLASDPAPETHLRGYPQELTDDLRDILSLMMWNTGPMAHALRAGGQDIKNKAEEEQAEVLHWLIGLALEHGSEWRAKASDRIREIQASVKAATTEGQP